MLGVFWTRGGPFDTVSGLPGLLCASCRLVLLCPGIGLLSAVPILLVPTVVSVRSASVSHFVAAALFRPGLACFRGASTAPYRPSRQGDPFPRSAAPATVSAETSTADGRP